MGLWRGRPLGRDDRIGAGRQSCGDLAVVNAKELPQTVEAVKQMSGGGVHVSIDALGHPQLCFDSISSLRKRGKHIQVGIMEAGQQKTAIPMDLIMGRELEIIGSHGMQAYKYPEMFEMILSGKLQPQKLIGKTITLEESLEELVNMNSFAGTGVTVIDRF
jgi:alcohol dehydrogenase